jgi:LysM repeat protein
MRKSCLLFLVSASTIFWSGFDVIQVSAQNMRPAPSSSIDPRQVEIANLRADIQALDRRMREMDMAMEELIRQNRELTAQVERQLRSQSGQMGDVVRQAQLNQAVNDIQQKNQAATAEMRRQILRDVTQQIEQLGKQTQAAIDALARNVSSRPSAPPARTQEFSTDFPREGVSYTVQRGDTLSGIASRHNSTVRDIQNANQIADPASIQVGQTLFIPQRRN